MSLLLLVPLSTTPFLAAQDAIFVVGGVASTVIDVDKTALAGRIEFTISTGTSGVGTMVVQYQNVAIANTDTTGVTVTGTGGLGAVAVLPVDQAAGAVIISVPAGGGPGDRITLDGVRVDVATAGVETVSANISALFGAGFTFLVGTTTVEVISSAEQGLVVVESDSDTVLEYAAIPASGPATKIVLREGMPDVFSDAMGAAPPAFGQNVATRVRILVLGLPSGSTITFPAIVTSVDTGATLTPLAGLELTVPTSSGDTTLTYEFTSGVGSSIVVETFTLVYMLDVNTSPTEPAVVSLQVSLFPIDQPNIPCFVNSLVPSDDELPLPEFVDFMPIQGNADQFQGLALTNDSTLTSTSRVELVALAAGGELVSGQDIINPATLSVLVGEQFSGLLQEVFGSGFSADEVAMVLIRSRRKRIVSLFLSGDQGGTFLDGATTNQTAVRKFLLPNLGREGAMPFTVVTLFNPSTTLDADVSLTLRDSGSVLASQTITLAPQATLSQDLSQLFGVDPAQVGTAHVRGSSTSEEVVLAFFGNTAALNLLPGQSAVLQLASHRVAHFLVGEGFDTELTLINSDSFKSATLEVTLFDDDGLVLQGTAPLEIFLDPGEQLAENLSSLFGLSPQSFVVGSIGVQAKNNFLGSFDNTPAYNGSVRIKKSDDSLSATLPLFSIERVSTLYPHVAQNLGFFTGLTVLNARSSSVTVTVEVFDGAGSLVGMSDFTLPAGGRIARLLNELIAESDGQMGGYFRVTATAGVISFALFGDLAGQFMSVIPSQ